MRYVSIFSGIEAASVAWAPLGWEPVCFSEIEPFPCAVLRERFPGVPNLGDITKIDWKGVVREHGAADLVVGGSPCQSFSIAGKRNGLEGASGLMWEYVRCVREVKPDWILWENVPGALSSSHGEDFRCLLESLDACGYGLSWRVLDAQFFGLAQRRERLFVVGRLGDVERPCEVLFEPESLSWDTPSSREKRQELAARAGGGAACAGFRCRHRPAVIDLTGGEAQASRVYSSDGIAPSLRAHGSGGNDLKVLCMADTQPHASVSGAIPASQSGKQVQGVMDGYVVRRLTPRECERLMGFPDDWTRVQYRGKPAEECPDTPRYKSIGNSMAVPVMRWIGMRIQEAES